MNNEQLPQQAQQMIPPLPAGVFESHNAIVQLTQTYAKLLQDLANDRNQHILAWRTIAEQTKKQLEVQKQLADDLLQQNERLRIALASMEQRHGVQAQGE